MQHIRYLENELYCEDVPLQELAEEFGTPLYVYSKNQILDNYREIVKALGDGNHAACYALKANSNPSLLSLIAKEGAGADVVSAGELSLALKAGFPPDRLVFAGVGKREDEIEYALKKDIFCFNVESMQELNLISKTALLMNKRARVALRLNPEIDAHSHPYITTGLKQNKFGLDGTKALHYLATAAAQPHIDLVGIHVHIGSQITKVEPFTAAAKFLVKVVAEAREAGIHLTHIDFGGGIGVQYVGAVQHETLPRELNVQPVPPLAEFVNGFMPILRTSGCNIWMEPGRAIVANAGVLLTRVIYQKENGEKKFIVVDAGMTELIRPSLYSAYHQIVPTRIETIENDIVDVVGPICESTDFLAKDRAVPRIKQGQYLAALTAGAYGYVLASNYNSRPRPAEVLVNGDRVRIVREREPLDLA